MDAGRKKPQPSRGKDAEIFIYCRHPAKQPLINKHKNGRVIKGPAGTFSINSGRTLLYIFINN